MEEHAHPPLYTDVTLTGTLTENAGKTFKFFRTKQLPQGYSLESPKKKYLWQQKEGDENLTLTETKKGSGEEHVLILNARNNTYLILLEDKTATFKDILKNGSIGMLYRLTQLPIPIIETVCLANIDAVKPGSLAAAGIISIFRNFVLHAPGSFTHLIAMNFNDEDPNSISVKIYAAQVIVTGIGALALPIPLFSSPILSNIFGINPVIANNIQSFFRAYAWGYFPLQWFGINRRIFTGIKAEQRRRALLVLIGALDTGVYITSAFGLIQGVFGTIYGNEGSGYAFSIAAGFSFSFSVFLIAINPKLRIYANPRAVTLCELKKEIKKILLDHIPISARFYVEQFALLWLSIWTGVIGHSSLVALQVCNTVIPFSEGPSFSFLGGCKASLSAAWINSSGKIKIITAQALSFPISYSTAFLIAASIAAKPLAKLFLHSQTPENQEIIENLVQMTLPIMASNELVSTFLHGQRTILQSVGARVDKKTDDELKYQYTLENRNPDDAPKSKIQMKESAIVTGRTAFFKLALFLPLTYAIGLKLDYGLPGMAGVYMLCMLALLLTLLPRTLYAMNHPDSAPQSYITTESFKNAARNLVTFCGTTFNGWRGTRTGDRTPLINNNIQGTATITIHRSITV